MTADNILKYPESCIVGKTIPKVAFTCHFDERKARREMKLRFTEDIDSIVWLYKIAATTCNVEPTEDIKELQVFLVNLKNKYCSDEVVNFVDKFLPQFIVFILKYEDEYRLLINYKQWANREHTVFNITATYTTHFRCVDQLSLPMQGQTTAQIYDNYVAQIAGFQLTGQQPLQEVVKQEQRKRKLLADIKALENAIRMEPQYNRQRELNQHLKQLRNELKQI